MRQPMDVFAGQCFSPFICAILFLGPQSYGTQPRTDLRRGFISASPEFVGDLLCAALFLKKLPLYLTRPTLGFRCTRPVGYDRINYLGILDEQLLVERDQLEQRAVVGTACKFSHGSRRGAGVQ